ncbi:hypothetical protein V8E36_001344 [Tilletia maclaganii]
MSSIFWRLLPFRVPRFFRRRQDTDYEVILQQLNLDIEKIQTRLTQIRARQRRAAITFTAYALGTWALYTLACYALGELTWEPLPLDDPSAAAEGLYSARTLFVWFPILLSPIVILSTRRIFGWWYKRIETAEEAHLQSLRKRQRAKIAEIKRATDFDHLRMLLDKYDEDRPRGAGTGPAQPGAQQRGGPGLAPRQSLPVAGPNAAGLAAQQAQSGRPQSAGRASAPRHSLPAQLQQQQQQQQPQAQRANGNQAGGAQVRGQAAAPQGSVPTSGSTNAAAGPASPHQGPPQRTVLDKFADWMFGPDPTLGGAGGVSAAMQKYALICTRCFAHNGLATPHEFDEIQYVCPKCGAFNSRRPSSVPVSTPAFFNRPSGQQSQHRPQPSTSSIVTPPPAVSEKAEGEGERKSDANEGSTAKAGKDEQGEDGQKVKQAGLRQRRAGLEDAEAMDAD